MSAYNGLFFPKTVKNSTSFFSSGSFLFNFNIRTAYLGGEVDL